LSETSIPVVRVFALASFDKRVTALARAAQSLQETLESGRRRLRAVLFVNGFALVANDEALLPQNCDSLMGVGRVIRRYSSSTQDERPCRQLPSFHYHS